MGDVNRLHGGGAVDALPLKRLSVAGKPRSWRSTSILDANLSQRFVRLREENAGISGIAGR